MIDEMARYYEEHVYRARKPHVCCECRGVIKAGEKYHHHFGIWSDGPSAYKICADCEELRGEVDSEVTDPEEGTAFGELIESVFNSGEQEWMKRFIEIKRKRSGPIAEWMERKCK